MLIYQYFHLFKKRNLQLNAYGLNKRLIYFRNAQKLPYQLFIILKQDLTMSTPIYAFNFRAQKSLFHCNFQYEKQIFKPNLNLQNQHILIIKLHYFK